MILIANPGSSTLKLSVHQNGRDPAPHSIEIHDDPSRLDRALKDWLDSRAGHQATGFGVRIVHGGTLFSLPVRVTDAVLSSLARLSPLTPLHMGPAIRTIESIRRMAPPYSCCCQFRHGISCHTFSRRLPVCRSGRLVCQQRGQKIRLPWPFL